MKYTRYLADSARGCAQEADFVYIPTTDFLCSTGTVLHESGIQSLGSDFHT